jgi:hypothetical protein
MTDNRHGMRSRRFVVFGRNETAQRWADAKDFKKISADDCAACQICLIVTIEAGRYAAPGDQTVENLILITQLNVVRVGENAARIAIENVNQALGVKYCKPSHQRRINQTEYGAVSADAERKSDDRDGSEKGTLQKTSDSVTNIFD